MNSTRDWQVGACLCVIPWLDGNLCCSLPIGHSGAHYSGCASWAWHDETCIDLYEAQVAKRELTGG